MPAMSSGCLTRHLEGRVCTAGPCRWEVNRSSGLAERFQCVFCSGLGGGAAGCAWTSDCSSQFVESRLELLYVTRLFKSNDI